MEISEEKFYNTYLYEDYMNDLINNCLIYDLENILDTPVGLASRTTNNIWVCRLQDVNYPGEVIRDKIAKLESDRTRYYEELTIEYNCGKLYIRYNLDKLKDNKVEDLIL